MLMILQDVHVVVIREKVVGKPEAAKVRLGYLNDFMTIHCGNTKTRHQTITTLLRVITGDHE